MTGQQRTTSGSNLGGFVTNSVMLFLRSLTITWPKGPFDSFAVMRLLILYLMSLMPSSPLLLFKG